MKNQPPILVSACLAGLATRYDGGATPFTPVLELIRQGRAIPVCPEQLGGRPTPRNPNEIKDGRVIDAYGEDLTEAFERGAREALKLAQLAGCTQAILKAKSPSCGSGRIYDGSFSGQMIDGDGVFAALLKKHGIHILSEETWTE
ncbi:MAG: DUF523 domain-containing protein [Proteobacteria bacterium]|nr:DUF523 domain-containing protein [Pseudomonadota bacterium]MBU1611325.1 DUF523 domain-containing protein [Pseudomonadota bacterium]